MTVIATNPSIGCAHCIFRTFQQLKVDVMSTNKRAGHVIPLIKASGIEQNACQCRLIVSKRL